MPIPISGFNQMTNLRRNRSFRTRSMLVVGVVGLLMASIMGGYAGDTILSDVKHSSRTLHRIEVALSGGARAVSGAAAEDGATSPADDPLENYKTAMSLLRKNYYAGPIDN